jgi:hypothetical protein
MKKRQTKPTASKFTILRQLCNLIPPHLVPKLARETGVDSMARSFNVTRASLSVSSSGFFRLITGPDSRCIGLSRSISRSQSGTCRRSLIFVIAGSRSIIRLSHLKHSHLMRNISPSVRMPARPPSTSQGSHSGLTAPRNDSNSSGLQTLFPGVARDPSVFCF